MAEDHSGSSGAAVPTADWLQRLIDWARLHPSRALFWLLGLHLVIWTLLPMLTNHNLRLDLAENLALGKEWQLGYWKHPPLPWWTSDLFYRLFGDVRSMYLLGPLSTVACFYAVWRLGLDTVDAGRALIAVLALEGLHFFNYSAVMFAHDQMQLPLWAFTGWFFYRAVTRGSMIYWTGAGAMLALAFGTKYAAVPLAATLGLILLLDPFARRSWRMAGPYLMAATFFVVISPHLWWLVTHDFMPFHYVDARAQRAAVWYQYLWYPLKWTAGQLFFLLPVLGMLAVLLIGASRTRPPAEPSAAFARRYVTALALGPFAITTLAAALLGRLPVGMWGYPLWSFLPLAMLMWFDPMLQARRLRQFAGAFIAVFVAMPVAHCATELLEPLISQRIKSTEFPGPEMAAELTRIWREKTGTPLAYVTGSEFTANLVAVHSPDRPRVLVQGDPRRSPWIDMEDLQRRGVLVAGPYRGVPASTPKPYPQDQMPEPYLSAFPRQEPQPPLVLASRGLRPHTPILVIFSIVRPRP